MISTVAQATAGRMGLNPKEMERFIKFAFVGVIGAVVDFGIFNLLRPLFLSIAAPDAAFSFGVPFVGQVEYESATIAVAIASGISFIAAIVSNFVWNRYWTYPDSRSKSFRRQFVQFVLVNVLGIIIRVPIVAMTHLWFEDVVIRVVPNVADKTAVLLGDNLAVVLAVAIVMFWNFFVNRYWTYNDVS